jgi:shikimate kinase
MTGGFQGIERVLLVGFMGCGKTTVGRLLADRAGWTFVDFDEEIERRLGRRIADIFDDEGEQYFREKESEVGRELLSRAGVVLASGGGWPTREGNWETAPRGTLSVWLEVAPETVVARLGEERSNRPLLAENDAFRQARTLMSARTAAYGRANCRVDTDPLTPLQVAHAIETLVDNRSITNQSSERMSN